MGDTKSREEKQRSMRYHRMFSAFLWGGVTFVAGLIQLSRPPGDLSAFLGVRGGHWPALFQIAVGVGLVLLGIHWARRLDDPRTRVRTGVFPRIRNVGFGRSKGAAQSTRRRLEPESDR